MNNAAEKIDLRLLNTRIKKPTGTVTVIYYSDNSLALQHDTKEFTIGPSGRVVLPDDYRKGKSIIAICEGAVNILNKVGERVLPIESVEATLVSVSP